MGHDCDCKVCGYHLSQDFRDGHWGEKLPCPDCGDKAMGIPSVGDLWYSDDLSELHLIEAVTTNNLVVSIYGEKVPLCIQLLSQFKTDGWIYVGSY